MHDFAQALPIDILWLHELAFVSKGAVC
jgi:hypothetical protein